jgi:hypothetical protein
MGNEISKPIIENVELIKLIKIDKTKNHVDIAKIYKKNSKSINNLKI